MSEVFNDEDGLFMRALSAFENEWEKYPRSDQFQEWEPDMGHDSPTIGLSALGSAYSGVVVVREQAGAWAVSSAATGERIDLATSARMLNMPANEVREALDATAVGLKAARESVSDIGTSASNGVSPSAVVTASFPAAATGIGASGSVTDSARRPGVQRGMRSGLER